MYQYLQGTLVEKSPVAAVIDVNGVGYLVQVPVSTYSGLPALGAQVRLLAHLVIREDAHQIYGFLTEDERELFRMLIAVSGIGPKSAMTVLSGIPIDELKQAIASGDLNVLTAIPGIGKKTAERLIVELKEKLVAAKVLGKSPVTAGRPGQGQIIEDSLQALVSLGYRKSDAKNAVEKTLKERPGADFSVEDLIRMSLKNI
ncbi:MAG TPA: Holliday junction branch migration protein RuvA [Verrucomicrobiae bacterium]|jgi:Holliday junction DNA helicase RuvA|nr:Holliday junction branch migration protein RuvA [Verrucomicrobiae bacterium]